MQLEIYPASQNFAIVLAAGVSRRMGTCKTALPWHCGKTLLTYQLEQWLIAGFTPVVVLGPHNCDRQQDCPAGSFAAINPCPNAGKTSSLLTGLASLPGNWQVLAISAVDQPRSNQIYKTLLQAHRASSAPITVPTYQGRTGHPLLFSPQVKSDLENLREETLGLRQLVRELQPVIQKIDFSTPDVLLDLNTPEIYRSHLLARI